MKILLFTILFASNLVQAETTIYLVRHAEKITTTGVKNPDLTQIGQFRAHNIANFLSSAGITQIFSTKYNRTIQTAQPLADFLNIEIKYYDPSKLIEFSEMLKKSSGNILVVGHSNTTPKVANLLSGKMIKPIEEKEYDNLYQVIKMDDKIILNLFKTIPSYGLDNTKTKTTSDDHKAKMSIIMQPRTDSKNEN